MHTQGRNFAISLVTAMVPRDFLSPGWEPWLVTTTAKPGSLSGRLTSASWWFRDSEGRQTVWQWPNPALSVWLVTLVLGSLDLSDAHMTAVDGIRHGAILVWSLDEVVRGASPFRRVLGAAVLAGQLGKLVLG